MSEKEWSRLWHHKHLNVSVLQAYHTIHAFPRHSHDYYVIAVVDSGLQSFTREGTKFVTPPDGLILLNPGDVHTGEPASDEGFAYRAFYPTIEHMAKISSELGGQGTDMPHFPKPRVDDAQMVAGIRSLFPLLAKEENLLETETRFLVTLVELVRRYGARKPRDLKIGAEHEAVRKVREYIDQNYDQPISLSELAEQVNFSRYYLLRTFRDATGMPPHVYLENVRVREAQKRLIQGQPAVQVAYDVGFGSQSHFIQRFKQIIGVPPGAYARQLGA